MATEVSWYYPERVVYVYISGILTIEQIAEGHRRNIELMESVEHRQVPHLPLFKMIKMPFQFSSPLI